MSSMCVKSSAEEKRVSLRLKLLQYWTGDLWLSKIIIDDIFTSSSNTNTDQTGLISYQDVLGDIINQYSSKRNGRIIANMFKEFITTEILVINSIKNGQDITPFRTLCSTVFPHRSSEALPYRSSEALPYRSSEAPIWVE